MFWEETGHSRRRIPDAKVLLSVAEGMESHGSCDAVTLSPAVAAGSKGVPIMV